MSLRARHTWSPSDTVLPGLTKDKEYAVERHDMAADFAFDLVSGIGDDGQRFTVHGCCFTILDPMPYENEDDAERDEESRGGSIGAMARCLATVRALQKVSHELKAEIDDNAQRREICEQLLGKLDSVSHGLRGAEAQARLAKTETAHAWAAHREAADRADLRAVELRARPDLTQFCEALKVEARAAEAQAGAAIRERDDARSQFAALKQAHGWLPFSFRQRFEAGDFAVLKEREENHQRFCTEIQLARDAATVRAEKAEAACAEMRAALEEVGEGVTIDPTWMADLMSVDVGKGWASPKQVRETVHAVKLAQQNRALLGGVETDAIITKVLGGGA